MCINDICLSLLCYASLCGRGRAAARPRPLSCERHAVVWQRVSVRRGRTAVRPLPLSCERHAVLCLRVAVGRGRTAVRPYLGVLRVSRCGVQVCLCEAWTHSSSSLPSVLRASPCGVLACCCCSFDAQLRVAASPFAFIPRSPPAISPTTSALPRQTPSAACSALLSRIHLQSC
jgi:hypothetical protein